MKWRNILARENEDDNLARSQMKYGSVGSSPMRLSPVTYTNKKQFNNGHHDNSDEFKNLGTLHRERRQVEFYPSDL